MKGSIFGSLPRRYARALIQIAQEENGIEAYGRALESTVEALTSPTQGPSFLKTLADESIDFNGRMRAMGDVADYLKAPLLFKNFLSLLVKKERVEILPEILREYRVFQDEILGIVRVSVVMPQLPSQEVLRRVESALSQRLKKKILTQGEADPSMIGGVILRVNHTVFDGSIRKELERIKNSMLNA